MISEDCKSWQTLQIEWTLKHSPYDGETLQLNCRVALLRRGEPFGATLYDLENFFARGIQLHVSQRIAQTEEAGCVGEKINGLWFIDMPDDQVAWENMF